MSYPYGSGSDESEYGRSKSAGSTGPYDAQSYPGQSYGLQPYSDQPYGVQSYPGQAYGSQAYGGQTYGAQYPQRRTNGMAIGSLVTSLASVIVLGGTTAFIGAILGHVALRQIKRTGEQGHGMALAGVIIGWVFTGLWIALIVIFVIFAVAVANSSSYT